MKYKIILNGAFHLFVKRILSNFIYYSKWLDRTQWHGNDDIEKLQLKMLKKIINYSYKTVPYYRNYMKKNNILPSDIKSLKDIEKFPILTKKDVISAGETLVSKKYNRAFLRKVTTSGTTGTPAAFYRNYGSIGIEHAFVKRQWKWAGLSVWDRGAIIKGQVIEKEYKNEKSLYAWEPFMRELYLSTHHLSEKTAKIYLKLISKYKINYIFGYPSAIAVLANVCINEKFNMPLKAVLTTSEVLTSNMKKLITKAFKCDVFDFCGLAERVAYIYTCEHGSYHSIPEYGYTEFLSKKDDKQDVYKIVATGFWNKAMPLIRYDTGDNVVISDDLCSCGRVFKKIDMIEGREGDVIKTPSGRIIGPSIITHTLYVLCGSEGFAESQIVQDAIDHITILYVPMDNFDSSVLNVFSKKLKSFLPDDLGFDFKSVKYIERTNTGKLKTLVKKF